METVCFNLKTAAGNDCRYRSIQCHRAHILGFKSHFITSYIGKRSGLRKASIETGERVHIFGGMVPNTTLSETGGVRRTIAAYAAHHGISERQNETLLCTSLTADSVQGMVAEGKEALEAGADVVELRLDFLKDFKPENDMETLLKGIELPCIVTYRPVWEGYVVF